MGGGNRTIVLMGRTGNGKSSTGNSILGKSAPFKARMSSGGVTSVTEIHSATLANGEVVNVIDTPGLFDVCAGTGIIRKEILRCVDLAKDDGIQAVLLVFSVRARFSEEEAASIQTLLTYFGPEVTPYIVVVFTGGDELEGDESLEDYLVDSPDPLQKIVQVCKNRVVLFDNKTNDEKKKSLQLQNLFTLLDDVLKENGGRSYTRHELAEFRGAAMLQLQKEEANCLKGKMEQDISVVKKELMKTCGQQLEAMSRMHDETKLKVATQILPQQLADETVDRLKAESDLKKCGERIEDVRKRRQNLIARHKKINEDAKRQPKDAVQIVREGLAIPHKAVNQFVADHAANSHRVAHQFVANVADHTANSHRMVHQFVSDHAATPHKVAHHFVDNVAQHTAAPHRAAHQFVASHAANSHKAVHHAATSALKFFGL